MKKYITILAKSIIIMVIIIAIITTILLYNMDDRGIMHIHNYYLVTLDKTYKESNNLIIVKNVAIEKLSKEDLVAYIYFENNQQAIRTGTINNIITTKTHSKIFQVVNERSNKIENIDSSCIIGTYRIEIPFIGLITKYLFSRDGFLIIIVAPLLIMCIYYLFMFVNTLNQK